MRGFYLYWIALEDILQQVQDERNFLLILQTDLHTTA